LPADPTDGCSDLLPEPDMERARQRAGAGSPAPSFDDCAALYLAAHEPSWRNAKHRHQWASTLRTYASPVFGSLPVAAIGTEHMLAVLRMSEISARRRSCPKGQLSWNRMNRSQSCGSSSPRPRKY